MNISEIVWEIRYVLRRAWLIAILRPFLRCPFCKGRGGDVSGYYEPEWTECRTCYPHYEQLEDHGCDWFVGRLPLLVWVRARVSSWCGLWYAADLLDVARCRLGLHDWIDEGDRVRGLKICRVCWDHEYDRKALAIESEEAARD